MSFYLQSFYLVLNVLLNILKLFVLLPQSPYFLTYYSISKGQTLSYTHLKLHSHYNPNDFFPVSALPRVWKQGNLALASPPLHLFTQGGAGDVAGWVLPCPASLLTLGRGRGQGTALTNDNPIPILRPKLNVPRLSILNFSFSQHLQLIVLISSICVLSHHQYLRPVPFHPGSS